MSNDHDVSRFREHLTLDECRRLLHHSHSIPVGHGFTAAYVAEQFSGWTWNELVGVFVAAGIFVNRGGAPATCDDRVAKFHFSGATEFYVEWVDGTEPEEVAVKRGANDRTTGQWMFDMDDGRFGVSIGGVEPE